MRNITVKILKHDCDGTPVFLAKLTQRGHLLKSMDDVLELYESCKFMTPNDLMRLPHTTIKRMNHITLAVYGCSTKIMNQFRTHAKRLTFITTSTQYSNYSDNFNCVAPINDKNYDNCISKLNTIYKNIADEYGQDIASYLAPQSLRKIMIIDGNVDDWEYVLRTRLCKRNSIEMQYLAKLIYTEIKNNCGENYLYKALPFCLQGKCLEGKLSCKKPLTLEELNGQ